MIFDETEQCAGKGDPKIFVIFRGSLAFPLICKTSIPTSFRVVPATFIFINNGGEGCQSRKVIISFSYTAKRSAKEEDRPSSVPEGISLLHQRHGILHSQSHDLQVELRELNSFQLPATQQRTQQHTIHAFISRDEVPVFNFCQSCSPSVRAKAGAKLILN